MLGLNAAVENHIRKALKEAHGCDDELFHFCGYAWMPIRKSWFVLNSKVPGQTPEFGPL